MRKVIAIVLGIVLLGGLFYAFEKVDPVWVEDNAYAKVIVHIGALVLALIFGFLTFTGGKVKEGISDLKGDIKNISKDMSGPDSLSDKMSKSSMFWWMTWWVIAFQLFVSIWAYVIPFFG